MLDGWLGKQSTVFLSGGHPQAIDIVEQQHIIHSLFRIDGVACLTLLLDNSAHVMSPGTTAHVPIPGQDKSLFLSRIQRVNFQFQVFVYSSGVHI